MSDDDDDHRPQDPSAAMLAAKQGRAVQMSRYEKYAKGEPTDFKNHQGNSFVETFNPQVYARPKTTRLNFTERYRFFDAVANSDEDTVGMMIDSGMDPSIKNEDGITPLHQCCIDNNLRMATNLVMRGANVNAQDCDMWTPLHAAAGCGFWRLSNMLMSHGADATMINADGDLALDVAENDKTKNLLIEEMKRLGYDSDKKLEELRMAGEHKLVEAVRGMVARGEDINTVDEFGFAPLHSAASNGWLDAIAILLEHKANVDVRDGDGNTPLHLAVFFNQYHAVELLSKGGADIEAKNRHMETPSIVTEDFTMMRILKALATKQDSTALLASVKRVQRQQSAAGRRHTGAKKDLSKMDKQGEHKALETGHQEPMASIVNAVVEEPSSPTSPSPAAGLSALSSPPPPSSSPLASSLAPSSPTTTSTTATATATIPATNGNSSNASSNHVALSFPSNSPGSKGDGDDKEDKRVSLAKARKPTQAFINVEPSSDQKKKGCCVLQ